MELIEYGFIKYHNMRKLIYSQEWNKSHIYDKFVYYYSNIINYKFES